MAEALKKLAKSALSTATNVLTKQPPKLWDPTKTTIEGWTSRFSAEWRVHGLAYAWNKVRMETYIRSPGQFVGQDANGNRCRLALAFALVQADRARRTPGLSPALLLPPRYYENLNAAYGRTRWVEYPVVRGTWAIDDKYDASMVHPDWHGWVHYTHDVPGNKVSADFSKCFKQHHRVNQTMLRPEYTTPVNFTSKDFSEGLPPAFHTPPGAVNCTKPRGRLGPKYQPWSPTGEAPKNELRNYANNTKILSMP